jgi:hypothetical protein
VTCQHAAISGARNPLLASVSGASSLPPARGRGRRNPTPAPVPAKENATSPGSRVAAASRAGSPKNECNHRSMRDCALEMQISGHFSLYCVAWPKGDASPRLSSLDLCLSFNHDDV